MIKSGIKLNFIIFIFFFGFCFFINNCSALINFNNQEQINVLKERIAKDSIKGALETNIRKLKKWQDLIHNNQELNLSELNISDNDFLLLKILLEYNKNIIALDLSFNPLTKFDSSGLSNLEALSLSDTKITKFDGSGLSNLEELDLSATPITKFDGSGLSNLEELDLSATPITKFDGSG